MNKIPFGTLLIGAAAVLAALIPGWPVMEIGHPTVGGVLLGHAAHTPSGDGSISRHLLWSTSTCLIFAWLFETLVGTRRFLIATLAGAVISGLAIVFLLEGAPTCRGLSSLGHVFAAAWAVTSIARTKGSSRATAAVILVLLIAKVTYETVTGQLVWAPKIGGKPAPIAHSSGAVAGILASVAFLLDDRRKKRAPSSDAPTSEAKPETVPSPESR